MNTKGLSKYLFQNWNGLMIKILFLGLAILPAFSAPRPYPPFSGEARNVNFDEVMAGRKQSDTWGNLSSFLTKPSRLPPAEKIVEELESIGRTLPLRNWPYVTVEGRMSLPSVLILPGIGLSNAMDSGYLLPYLSGSSSEDFPIVRYSTIWNILVNGYPDKAFALMAESSDAGSSSTIDILRVQSTLGDWPGMALTKRPSKEMWIKLHESNNPCARIIALDKFDSVTQSPSESLALYRECFFNACTYFEVRALEAILSNQDFRPEVLALLKEYIDSNPLKDDGTMPLARNKFPDLIAAAKQMVNLIENQPKTTQIPSPSASGLPDPTSDTTSENQLRDSTETQKVGQLGAEDIEKPLARWAGILCFLAVLLTAGFFWFKSRSARS